MHCGPVIKGASVRREYGWHARHARVWEGIGGRGDSSGSAVSYRERPTGVAGRGKRGAGAAGPGAAAASGTNRLAIQQRSRGAEGRSRASGQRGRAGEGRVSAALRAPTRRRPGRRLARRGAPLTSCGRRGRRPPAAAAAGWAAGGCRCSRPAGSPEPRAAQHEVGQGWRQAGGRVSRAGGRGVPGWRAGVAGVQGSGGGRAGGCGGRWAGVQHAAGVRCVGVAGGPTAAAAGAAEAVMRHVAPADTHSPAPPAALPPHPTQPGRTPPCFAGARHHHQRRWAGAGGGAPWPPSQPGAACCCCCCCPCRR